jgi:hypothetical protein
MFNSVLLDTIIGLAFIYLIFSFLCLVITEMITRFFNKRHVLLQNALQKLFDGAKEGHLVPKLNDNLSMILGDIKKKRLYKKVSNLTPAQLTEGLKITFKNEVKFSLRAPDSPVEMVEYAKKLSRILDDELLVDHSKKPTKSDPKTSPIDQLEKKLNEKAGEILDKVYSLYTIYAQKIALFIALCLVIINNADSIKYAQRIYTDNSFREILVKSAEKAIENENAYNTQSPGNDVLNTKFLNSLQNDMKKTGLDLGVESWTNEPLFNSSNGKADHWWWIQKIMGLLLTTAMVSLGAPFWLDAIKKLTGLKKNGKQDSAQVKSGT